VARRRRTLPLLLLRRRRKLPLLFGRFALGDFFLSATAAAPSPTAAAFLLVLLPARLFGDSGSSPSSKVFDVGEDPG
jgi:hypothetical protein